MQTLIDSGNLCGDLISESLAKALKLKIHGRERSVGTAASSGKVTILGHASPFKIYLENIAEAVLVHPLVVRDLAHPLNLGQAFLRRNEVDLSFRAEYVHLKIGRSITKLETEDSPLTRSTIDTRIRTVLDKLKDQGGNPFCGNAKTLDVRIAGVNYSENKTRLSFLDTKYRVENKGKVLLKAGHTTPIVLKINASIPGKSCNEVQLIPKADNKWLNQKELFVQPGVYVREGDCVSVLMTNFGARDVYLPKACYVGQVLEAEESQAPTINVLNHKPLQQITERELNERRTYIIDSLKLNENPLLKGNAELREEIIRVFLENFDAVAISESDYGRTELMEFTFDIPRDAIPVRDKLRPLNPFQEQDLRRQLDAWLDADVIEEALSPWGSALVPIKKKGSDKLRWAIDYRKVNQLTVKDAYPLSQIEGNLHKLAGAKIFSTLDSQGAFHSMPIKPEHRDYTAFLTPWGQFRFTRLPFGVSNGPPAYSRLVQLALSRLPEGFALAYIDDIILYSANVYEHLAHLEQVLKLHVQAGMKLNMQKCKLFQEEVIYLGHAVSENGIRMVDEFIARIKDWPIPASGKELASFLGFCGYYRAFIKDFAHLTFEMNKMKKDKIVQWTEETKKKFEDLKTCFVTAPTRGYPRYDTEHPFILDTDFSSTNLAAVLSQVQDGAERFLGCASRKCSKPEQHYAAFKGELAALILGLHKFDHILRAKKFIVRTDSTAVKFLHNLKEFRGIYARWYAYLAGFDFTLVHRAGKQQVNADVLSRRAGVPEDAEGAEEPEMFSDVLDVYALTPIEVISPEKLRAESQQDFVLGKIIDMVKAGRKPDKHERKGLTSPGMCYVNIFECLHVKEGILMYQPPEIEGRQEIPRICLPVSLYGTAFDLCHSDKSGIAGHFGMQKTYLKMKEHFYFPQMFSYIQVKVANCLPCLSKTNTLPPIRHQQYQDQLSFFNERLHIDIVGPLNPSMYAGKSCRYFFTMQDAYTRWLVAKPIPEITTKQVAETLLESWVYQYGVPVIIHSDQGSQFTSELFKEVMKALGIIKTQTPTYSPSGNRVERAHQVLGKILRADSDLEKPFWAKRLHIATFAYNNCVNRNIGCTPYYALYGRAASLPLDLIFPTQVDRHTFSEHIQDIRLKFSRIFQSICEHQGQAMMRANPPDLARGGARLQPGDTVFYFVNRVPSGLATKLNSRWQGPWTVKKIISDSLITIFPIGDWAKNAKEILTIANRVRKIDPHLSRDMNLAGKKVDLEEIIAQDDPEVEIVSYQPVFEGEYKRPALGTHLEVRLPSPPIVQPSEKELLNPPHVKEEIDHEERNSSEVVEREINEGGENIDTPETVEVGISAPNPGGEVPISNQGPGKRLLNPRRAREIGRITVQNWARELQK